MGMFEGMDQADVGQSRNNLAYEHADYLVQIKRVLFKDGRNGKFYIVEFLILESSCAKNPRGTAASWLQKMSGTSADVCLGAIKGFLAACFGADPNNQQALKEIFTDAHGADISTAAAELSVADDNPMVGNLVRVHTNAGKKKDGGPFTYHDWTPSCEGDEALVLPAA